jgi:hypothetical protein
VASPLPVLVMVIVKPIWSPTLIVALSATFEIVSSGGVNVPVAAAVPVAVAVSVTVGVSVGVSVGIEVGVGQTIVTNVTASAMTIWPLVS